MSNIEKLKIRRGRDPILDYYGNPYQFKKPDPPPPVSEMNKKDKIVAGLIMTIHAMSLGAPLTWGPGALKWLGVNYFLCLLGITASFHR